MKKFLTLIPLLASVLMALPAQARFPRPRDTAFELDHSPFGQRVSLGLLVEDKATHVLRGQWDFAVSGGANNSTINLLDMDGKAAVLPPGAIVKNCVVLVDALLASSGSALVTLSTGGYRRGDLVNVSAFTNFGINDGLVGCTVVGGSASTWVKLPGNYTAEYTPGYTSEYTPTLTITGAALTGGKFRLLLEYLLSR